MRFNDSDMLVAAILGIFLCFASGVVYALHTLNTHKCEYQGEVHSDYKINEK